VLHGELCDRSRPGGEIGRRDAAGRGIDYLALGHYHSYSAERIDERCTAVYPGTPEGRGFDETGDKGYVLVECDVGGARHRFVPFSRRRLHEIRVDVSGVSDLYTIEDTAEKALADIASRDLVRLLLTGYLPVGVTPDLAALTARFATRYYFFEAKDETRLKINASDYEHDISLKGEFIRLVMRDPSLPAKKKEEIIACGLAALFGEVTL
jgi:DNA repair exonuclease SbcCD nuclease subunit